jgi:hypothetical protein
MPAFVASWRARATAPSFGIVVSWSQERSADAEERSQISATRRSSSR